MATVTGELDLKFYLILVSFILKSYIQLEATALDYIGQHSFIEYNKIPHP